MNNLHWAITAYDKEVKMKNEDSYLIWYKVDIQVKHFPTEEEAIKRARQIVKRKYYKLYNVFECDCAKNAVEHRKQLEASKEYTEVLKKQFGKDDE